MTSGPMPSPGNTAMWKLSLASMRCFRARSESRIWIMPQRDELGLLPPPLAGEGWGAGDLQRSLLFHAPSLSLQPKSDVSDFGQLIKRPNSGKPEFGCERGRGRCGAAIADTGSDHLASAQTISARPPGGPALLEKRRDAFAPF